VDEAESIFSLPVMAAVPEAKSEIKKGAIIVDQSGSPQAEAFRNLRASVSLLGEEAKRRLILVTSAIPSEGKTFTSTNLAASFAVQDLKTLIIDADLRRPALSSNLLESDDRKHEDYRGLSDVLSGICTTEEAIRETSIPNLSLLPSGRRAPNPGELLTAPLLDKLFEKFLTQYDRVVVDTAPVNAVSDALSLAPKCHVTLMVMRFGKTPRRVIKRAVTLLQKNGARLSGLIMNRMPTSRGASYYYYYYGEDYHGESNGKSKSKSKSKQK
jgi:polysaccharide biosynthesis transport protein